MSVLVCVNAVEGPVHGEDAGVEDVEFVNLFRGAGAHGPCQSVVLDDGAQLAALMVGELLRVVQQRMLIVVGQHNGSCKDRSCEAATASLVDTSFRQSCIIMALQHITLTPNS